MPLACHLDHDLKDRLFKLLHRPSRQPSDWTVPIKPCDLKRLMGAAGIEPVGGFFDGEVYRPDPEQRSMVAAIPPNELASWDGSDEMAIVTDYDGIDLPDEPYGILRDAK